MEYVGALLAREQWLEKQVDWANLSIEDTKAVLALCNCIRTNDAQGRNPFPYVNENASAETEDGRWLVLGNGKWQIGDNVKFPSSFLLIRDVNKYMYDFIIDHFEGAEILMENTLVPIGVTQTTAHIAASKRVVQSGSLRSDILSGSTAAILGDEEEEEPGPTLDGKLEMKISIDKLQRIQNHQRTATAFVPKPPIHVGGTPGTGKTAFGLFLLHKLLQRYSDDSFIYRHGDVNPGCFVYYKERSYHHPSIVQAFSDELCLKVLTKNFTRPIWTILDGAAAIPTGTPTARMIVLTSPGQQTIPLKHLLKYSVTIVNPPWHWREVDLLRRAAFPHLSKEDVQTNYNRWGGVPRFLLDYGDKREKLKNLEDSIYITDPFALFRQAGLSRIDHANVSGLHFHLIPGEKIGDNTTSSRDITFQYASYCWATTWLQERFWELLKNEQGEISIMNFLLDRNNVAAARAYAFEPHVFRTIQNSGIEGLFRKLTTEGFEDMGVMALSSLRRRTFNNFSDIPSGKDVHNGYFYVPHQTNHMSIDMYVPNEGLLVQVTIGQKHGVKMQGLRDAVQSGIFEEWRVKNPTEKLKLVFLCDGYNFSTFSRQPYLTAKGTTVKSEAQLNSLNNMFEQYSFELNVEMQLDKHLNAGQRKERNPVAKINHLESGTVNTQTDAKDGEGKPEAKRKRGNLEESKEIDQLPERRNRSKGKGRGEKLEESQSDAVRGRMTNSVESRAARLGEGRGDDNKVSSSVRRQTRRGISASTKEIEKT